MTVFGHFYLDKKGYHPRSLYGGGDPLLCAAPPNHATGNLITNLARLCGLSLSFDADGLKIVRGLFINRHATSLYSKARTLRGYTAVIEDADAAEQILEAVKSVWDEMQ